MDMDVFICHDFLRFYLVFIHVLTSTIVVGSIISTYIEFWSFGYFTRKRLLLEHKIVFYSLIILIASGAGIIYLDVGIIRSFEQLFSYRKLTAKLFNVTILILNGFFIRYYVSPKMTVGVKLSRKHSIIFGGTAGLSLAAWLNSIFIGKASVLTSILDLEDFIILCLLVLGSGLIFGALSFLLFTIKIKE